jgi:hypothetical protein
VPCGKIKEKSLNQNGISGPHSYGQAPQSLRGEEKKKKKWPAFT